MEEDSKTFHSSWTLAEQLIFEIAGYLKTGRNYWLRGELEKYYWEFEAVVRVLWGILDEDEKITAKKKEDEIIKNLPINIQNIQKKNVIAGLLKDYDGIVMTFIHKHKLDMPPKRDTTNL